MSGVRGSLCTMEELRSDNRSADGCRRLRLTLQEHRQPPGDKPIGRAFALVQPPNDRTALVQPANERTALVQPANERTVLNAEPVKPPKEKVEVIKVYLEASRQEQLKHQQSLKMLSDEVSHIQEVRYSLKSLREHMAAKNKRTKPTPAPDKTKLDTQVSFSLSLAFSQRTKPTPASDETKLDTQEVEAERLREVSKRLYAQLQDTEKTHLEERERLQAEGNTLHQRLSEQEEALRSSEEQSGSRAQRLEELHRLLAGMEQESAALRDTVRQREDALQDLRRTTEEGHAQAEQRAEQLEQEVAILKEKIHHLDDMLKSQQRKVRHMIEQLQNSRTVIQERDRVIRELEEKVAFLESENRQMHDQMDYFLEGQRSNSYLSSELNPHIVYSKPLKPSTSSSNKPLPFIKVIEISS